MSTSRNSENCPILSIDNDFNAEKVSIEGIEDILKNEYFIKKLGIPEKIEIPDHFESFDIFSYMAKYAIDCQNLNKVRIKSLFLNDITNDETLKITHPVWKKRLELDKVRKDAKFSKIPNPKTV